VNGSSFAQECYLAQIMEINERIVDPSERTGRADSRTILDLAYDYSLSRVMKGNSNAPSRKKRNCSPPQ